MPIHPSPPAIPSSRKQDGVAMPLATQAYTEEYKEKCFLAWYAAGKPRGQAMVACVPEDDYGRKPHKNMILSWKQDYGWKDRADRLDGEVTQQLEAIAIEEKVKMFRRHAEIGEGLIEVGYDYIMKNGPESSATAARLIKDGAELERVSTGGAQAMVRVAEMSDRSLLKTINDLLEGSTNKDGEIDMVDAEFQEAEE